MIFQIPPSTGHSFIMNQQWRARSATPPTSPSHQQPSPPIQPRSLTPNSIPSPRRSTIASPLFHNAIQQHPSPQNDTEKKDLISPRPKPLSIAQMAPFNVPSNHIPSPISPRGTNDPPSNALISPRSNGNTAFHKPANTFKENNNHDINHNTQNQRNIPPSKPLPSLPSPSTIIPSDTSPMQVHHESMGMNSNNNINHNINNKKEKRGARFIKSPSAEIIGLHHDNNHHEDKIIDVIGNLKPINKDDKGKAFK